MRRNVLLPMPLDPTSHRHSRAAMLSETASNRMPPPQEKLRSSQTSQGSELTGTPQFPWARRSLDREQSRIHEIAGRPDQRQIDEEAFHIEVERRDLDAVAEAADGADHLGRDDGKPPQAQP